MNRFLPLLLSFLLIAPTISAQDTFSIIAVDSVTGQVGAAGASCVSLAPLGAFINRLVPGVGAVTCQSTLSTVNRDSAANYMVAGLGPQQILDSLYNLDSNNQPETRQNMAIDFDSAAVFTGDSCFAWAGGRVGPNYVIAGNILMGPEILDSLEIGFNSTNGSLADKLMGALNKANVVGADSRCGQYGTSSLSAFIRVAYPSDQIEDYTLDLFTIYPPQNPQDPIAQLNQDYQNWLATEVKEKFGLGFDIYPNPGSEVLGIAFAELPKNHSMVEVYDLKGKVVLKGSIEAGQRRFQFSTKDVPVGVYAVRIGNTIQRWIRY